jgi:broad specificity phosphatase PhoE
MATFLLIRHAEPALRGVFLGQMDPPLSPEGHRQAKVKLAGLTVSIAYTSPLLRALETARYLPCRQVIPVSDLREVDMGAWTGKTWEEIESSWKDMALAKSSDWLGVAAPDGESWTEVIARVTRAWEMMRHGPAPIAVIAHQGVNAALAHVVAGLNPLGFHQQYGEVTRIEYAED